MSNKFCPATEVSPINLTIIEFQRDELLSEIFAATARRVPERPALMFQEQIVTYRALDELSEHFAQALLERGIRPGDFVGLWMERSIELHIALLGILKAGAAYIPFDAAAPHDRVATSLLDCQAKALIVSQKRSFALDCPVWTYEEISQGTEGRNTGNGLRDARTLGATKEEPAYAIYTSGSTGRPKGIVISHSNVCHWVRSENHILGIREDDIVYQGFSLAFDMSIEEIWPAYLVGACLWVAPMEVIRALDQLPAILRKAGVSVLHAVPTLLATFEEEVPSLRLINLGGEACPSHLVERWAVPGRRLLNTYGPTETTVTATWAECHRGTPVTIGQPLPNYLAYVLDDDLRPVPVGVSGELVIGGPGVSGGYINRPRLTAEKFIPNPFPQSAQNAPTLYRTGDLVRFDDTGNLHFEGRIDDQVKLRGFRIELGEIEAQLAQLPTVKSVAVAVVQDSNGIEQLVAFVVAKETWNAAQARDHLNETLPCYMVPGRFVIIQALPTLASGKVDRKSLAKQVLPIEEPVLESQEQCSPTEQQLRTVWQTTFPGQNISINDDFFKDLGGHSLLAAVLVSRLRTQPNLRNVSLQDLYQYRTIAALASQIDHFDATTTQQTARIFQEIPALRYALCLVAQGLSLPIIYGMFAIQWLVPYLTYSWIVDLNYSIGLAILGSIASYCGMIPLTLGLSIIVKWLVIGRYQSGEYPLWGSYYFRWWFVRRFLAITPVSYLSGTPLLRLYFKLLGANIGEDTYLSTVDLDAADLVSIGAHTSIGHRTVLHNGQVEDGLLKLGTIHIGEHCYVGSACVLERNTVLENWSELGDLSCVNVDGEIPEAQIWAGSPASFVEKAHPEAIPAPKKVSTLKRFAYSTLFAALALVYPVLALMPVFPGFMVLNYLDRTTNDYRFLVISPLLALLLVVLTAMQLVALRWLLLGRVQEGTYELYSSFYVRKWLLDQLMEMSLSILHPLYATLYLAPWFRMMGTKVGHRTEISTASPITHDLLEIGDEAFIADAVIMSDPHIRHNRMVLVRTHIGNRSFVGNSAIVPDGSNLPDDCLIGCLTLAPTDPEPGSCWFGVPALNLPARQPQGDFPKELTFQPPNYLVVLRFAVESIRIILPVSVVMALSVYLVSIMVDLNEWYDFGELALIFPMLYIGFGLTATLVTVVLKWLLVGRYTDVVLPMWNPRVWLSELVTSTYESLAVTYFLDLLRGTPFLPLFLRLLGCHIGKRVYLDTSDFTEFDMITIEDECSLNFDCGPQTHLFEDRVMKVGSVTLAKRATLGSHSIVLYSACLEENCRLGAVSMAMKGEHLPANGDWCGSPARPVQASVQTCSAPN